MGASATLSAPDPVAEPGGEASFTVTIRNTGHVVDELSVDVVGEASQWAVVDPPLVRLFPGTEGTVQVTFRPPRDASVGAGAIPFGIRVSSHEDPEGSAVEEGTLTIGAFSDVTIELLPHTSRGRRRAKAEVAIDNRGNTALGTGLGAGDPDSALRFSLDPPSLIIEPGEAVFAEVDIRPVRRFWKGQTRTLPFQVVAQADGQVPTTTDGVFVQEQLLPKWLLKALLALLALLLLAVLLWYALLRPTIESAAQDTVAEEVEPLAERVDAMEEAAADQAAAGGGSTPPAGGEDTPPTETTAPVGSQPVSPILDIGAAMDFRIPADPPVTLGETDDFTFTPDEGVTISITDVLLQNPAGDAGRLRVIRRSGSGDEVLLDVGLANFRDLDYHFVSPLRIDPGESVVVQVLCTAVGTATPPAAAGCTPAVSFSGGQKATPPAG